MAETATSPRRRAHEALDPRVRPASLSVVNKVLVALILFSTLLAILETEETLVAAAGGAFRAAELMLGAVFTLEYLARLWTAPEREPGTPAWRQRLRFATSPAGLADLVAIAGSLIPAGAGGTMLLRLVRLARILRLAKLARFSRALAHVSTAIRSRGDELLLSLVVGLGLMVVAATLLHLVEGPAQPDKFGSIPRALWWAVATLTTIGYGDVYPVTVAGKLLAAVTAVFSIGVVAMPTGILAAAFSDAVQRHRAEREEEG